MDIKFEFRTDFEKAVYEAFLKSALAMGDDLKKLSWFGSNL